MKFVADLHLHSKYSRAVSQEMVLSRMQEFARIKGINVLSSGDFTHPFWFEHLKQELVDCGNGLFQVKNLENIPLNKQVFIMLGCEISSIYSQGGKGRRIHNLFFFPSLESVSKFNATLLKRGANLRSDGRPIVGISSRELAKIALDVDENALIIPAHAWTPWFSLFGSFSGFDSVEECFGDMAAYIYGIETGLSSDPGMNWRVEDLDKRAILSFSDAHSLEKMGREVTVFEADEISYGTIYKAIRWLGDLDIGRPNYPRIAFTIEFYPEEGKYHFTGHRDCNFNQKPEETKQDGEICPVCKRPLTVGVMHRVEDLATRSSDLQVDVVKNGLKWTKSRQNRPPYVSLVPLYEIIAEALGVAPKTKKVNEVYMSLVNNLGSEFGVLMSSTKDEIARFSSQRVAEGVEKVRIGAISIDPGYDGKYGIVKIWDELKQTEKREQEKSQLNLFA